MTHKEQCLCAPPGITRAGYAALLEQRRAAHVRAWRWGIHPYGDYETPIGDPWERVTDA